MFVARALHCITTESEKRALKLCSANLNSFDIPLLVLCISKGTYDFSLDQKTSMTGLL